LEEDGGRNDKNGFCWGINSSQPVDQNWEMLMTGAWTKLFRSVYRREPISSFILTMGAVDAVLGWGGDSLPLMALGAGTVSVAIVLRWWLAYQRYQLRQVFEIIEPIAPPVRYLPDRSARPLANLDE
jgi:hypothetical protein